MTRVRTELVFALTAAVGANLKPVTDVLGNYLREDYGYKVVPIKVSDILGEGSLRLDTAIDATSQFNRYLTLMDAGTEARRKFGDDALARIAVSRINSVRAEGQPRLATAYVIHQLKHPAEVDLLRQVYGPGFFLIGVFEGEEAREERLHADLRIEPDKARKLIDKDKDEAGKDHGQKSSKTFQKADVFVQATPNPGPELRRFVDLVFGDPFTTPSRDEYAMFMAYAASLRSAELGRQVGAAVFSQSGEMLAIGANEVPAPGGGLYWPPPDLPEGLPRSEDGRDFSLLKHDSNHQRRLELVEKILSTLGVGGDDPRRKDIDRLVSNLTEYGRAVHAELEALLACSRIGVSVRGGTLFTTTFPCHNCVRHIVASGVHRVVFIEPYPKSLATELHDDAIVLASPGEAGTSASDPRVFLEPFVGVGPRRYPDLFSTSLSSGHEVERKSKVEGTTVPDRAPGHESAAWKRAAVPRVPLPATNYIDREAETVGTGTIKVADMLKSGET